AGQAQRGDGGDPCEPHFDCSLFMRPPRSTLGPCSDAAAPIAPRSWLAEDWHVAAGAASALSALSPYGAVAGVPLSPPRPCSLRVRDSCTLTGPPGPSTFSATLEKAFQAGTVRCAPMGAPRRSH